MRRGEIWRLAAPQLGRITADRPQLAAMAERMAARPVLILSATRVNEQQRHVSTCPIETADVADIAFLAPRLTENDPVDGWAHVSHAAYTDKRRLAERLGEVTEAVQYQVDVALRALYDLNP